MAVLRFVGARMKPDSAYMQLERNQQQQLSQVQLDDKRAVAQARARQAQQIESVLAQVISRL